MSKPWQTDSCDDVFAYHSIYPISVAAALWCKVPAEYLNNFLAETTEVTPGIYRHPETKCFEVKCRAMHNAIVAGALPVSRENGIVATDHVAPARRHVSRQHLKEWIMKEFPGNKPGFLFDEIERKSHTSINADSYRSLQADRDALHTENEKLTDQVKQLSNEKIRLIEENKILQANAVSNDNLPARLENRLLKNYRWIASPYVIEVTWRTRALNL